MKFNEGMELLVEQSSSIRPSHDQMTFSFDDFTLADIGPILPTLITQVAEGLRYIEQVLGEENNKEVVGRCKTLRESLMTTKTMVLIPLWRMYHKEGIQPRKTRFQFTELSLNKLLRVLGEDVGVYRGFVITGTQRPKIERDIKTSIASRVVMEAAKAQRKGVMDGANE